MKASRHGKLLVPHEPVASILKEAFEGFASGLLATQADVVAYLQNHPSFAKALKWFASSASRNS
jgi:hypothetical protein